MLFHLCRFFERRISLKFIIQILFNAKKRMLSDVECDKKLKRPRLSDGGEKRAFYDALNEGMERESTEKVSEECFCHERLPSNCMNFPNAS